MAIETKYQVQVNDDTLGGSLECARIFNGEGMPAGIALEVGGHTVSSPYGEFVVLHMTNTEAHELRTVINSLLGDEAPF